MAQPVASLEITSSLGNVMDADESTDITVTAKNAGGTPLPNVPVTVTRDRDVADNSPADSTNVALPGGPFITGANGKVVINTQPGINNEEVAVSFKAAAGAVNATLAIETDEAVTTWDEYPTAQALATTDTTEGGVVELPSGSVLPGRTIGLTLVPTGNALFSPQAEQPAGTTRGGDLIASAVTDAAGRYSVKVDDPALPNGQELNNVLRGSANFAATGFNINGATSTARRWLAVCRSVLSWTSTGCARSRPPALRSTTTSVAPPPMVSSRASVAPLRPGGLGIGEVVAFNSDNVELEDVNVNLTIDQGFFVNLEDAFDGTPAVGAPVDFKSAGKTITVNTGEVVGSGGTIPFTKGAFAANIERHTGFDDNGNVSDEIDATAGTATDEHDFTWSTNNVPINPRATNPLIVELSDDQESSILPKARAGNVQDDVDFEGDGDGSGQVVELRRQHVGPVREPDVAGSLDHRQRQPVGRLRWRRRLGARAQPACDRGLRRRGDRTSRSRWSSRAEFTTTYFDDVTDSSFDPTDPLDNIQFLPVVVDADTAAINWYELNLNASEFSLGQDGSEQRFLLARLSPRSSPRSTRRASTSRV